MVIDTKVGPRDPDLLVCDRIEVDNGEFFGVELSFLDPETRQEIARFRQVKIDKLDHPWSKPESGNVTTTRGELPVESLAKETGTEDGPNHVAWWANYRLPGSTEVIKRRTTVAMKRSPDLAARRGSVG